MESLDVRTEMLLETLKCAKGPGSCEVRLEKYAADGLREEQISLYEAFLIQAEVLSFMKSAYTQAAWGRKVGIRELLKILNMKLLSVLFQDEPGAEAWSECGVDAYKRNQEVRPHYILDEYLRYLNAENDPAFLKKLLKMRQCKKKPFDNGPYHDEVFPYSKCNFEKLLLEGKKFSADEKQISETIENLLVELYLLQEE